MYCAKVAKGLLLCCWLWMWVFTFNRCCLGLSSDIAPWCCREITLCLTWDSWKSLAEDEMLNDSFNIHPFESWVHTYFESVLAQKCQQLLPFVGLLYQDAHATKPCIACLGLCRYMALSYSHVSVCVCACVWARCRAGSVGVIVLSPSLCCIQCMVWQRETERGLRLCSTWNHEC